MAAEKALVAKFEHQRIATDEGPAARARALAPARLWSAFPRAAPPRRPPPAGVRPRPPLAGCVARAAPPRGAPPAPPPAPPPPAGPPGGGRPPAAAGVNRALWSLRFHLQEG